jgi:hypothetical protein
MLPLMANDIKPFKVVSFELVTHQWHLQTLKESAMETLQLISAIGKEKSFIKLSHDKRPRKIWLIFGFNITRQ